MRAGNRHQGLLPGEGTFKLGSRALKTAYPLADLPSPDSPEESFVAPIEIRHFTEGTFPPDFELRLFSHSHIWANHNREQPKEQGVSTPTGGPIPGELGTLGGSPGRAS